jgi:hypothetical protein
MRLRLCEALSTIPHTYYDAVPKHRDDLFLFHNKELRNLFRTSISARMASSRELRWAGYVASMGENICEDENWTELNQNIFNRSIEAYSFIKKIYSACQHLTTRFVEFEVITAVVMKSTIFWDITPCSLLKVNRRFGGTYRLYIQGRRISRARNQRESRWQAEALMGCFDTMLSRIMKKKCDIFQVRTRFLNISFRMNTSC